MTEPDEEPEGDQRPSRFEREEPRDREDDEDRDAPRRGFERLLPDLIRRGVEAGLERLGRTDDSLRNFIAQSKLPKEIASHLLAQIDETKNGLFRVVAKEIRDFLENTNVAEEIKKALTSMSFEIKTEVRFVPNESGGTKPDVKAEVKVQKP